MRYLNFLIVFFSFVICAKTHAQSCNPGVDCKQLFASEEVAGNAVIAVMKIPGSGPSLPDIPLVNRTASNGVVEWEYQGDLNGHYFAKNIRLFDISEDFIYVLLTIDNSATVNPSIYTQIWKLNKITGALEWESQLFDSDYETQWHSVGMFEYDQDLVGFYNAVHNNGGGSIGGFELYTIDKTSNAVDTIYQSTVEIASIHMLSDHQGNIITAIRGAEAVVEKFNGLDLNHRIWHQEFSQTTNASVVEIEDFIIDKKGSLYLFSKLDGFTTDSLTLTKFNGMSGELLWSLSLADPFMWLRDYKIVKNELYVGLREVSGTPQYGGMVKVDMENGALIWSNYNLQYNTAGSAGSCTGAIQGIRSFDVDCDGFVYATGFDRSLFHDNASAAWGLMKIDNNSGTMINSNVVTLDQANVDYLSQGTRMHILNDTLFMLGYLQSGSASRVLTVVKCDKFLSNFQYPWFTIDHQVACDSLTWINGITYTSSNNVAAYNLNGSNGCDSVIMLDLTINNYSETDIITSCGPVTWIDGNTYNANNNTATYMFTSINGCDSLVTLDLSIQPLNTTLINNDPTLTANSSSATYQWLDCDNNYALIPGETGQSFTATSNGNYALEVTENGCTDTSNCAGIATVGIGDNNSTTASFIIYPNPTMGIVNLEFSDYSGFSSIKIYNVLGQIISETFVNKNQLSLELGEATGVYYMELVKSSGHNQMVKVIKQ